MSTEEPPRWYNSKFFTDFGEFMGVAALVLSAAFLFKSCGPTDNELERERIKAGYVFQKIDLNNNRIPEEFYQIGEKKYYYSIDGTTIETYLSLKDSLGFKDSLNLENSLK